MSFTIDIDGGGTFTDGFFSDGSSAILVKVDTTPHELTLGFHRCLEQGATRLGQMTSPGKLSLNGFTC